MARKSAERLWLLDVVRIVAFAWTIVLHTEAMLFLAAPADLVEQHYKQNAGSFLHRAVYWQVRVLKNGVQLKVFLKVKFCLSLRQVRKFFKDGQ
jgi:hypothetical protein